MKPLKAGKFYRTMFGHYFWKTDRAGPAPRAGNASLMILQPGSLVLFTKFAKFRYIQVVFGEQVGYIWCNTDVALEEHLRGIDLNDPEEQAPILDWNIRGNYARLRS